ncbi:hypothetical protein LINPERPRIM_LOCUS43632 [Linum perenne]
MTAARQSCKIRLYLSCMYVAQVEDFLFPKKGSSDSSELAIMEKIFLGYVMFHQDASHTPSSSSSIVAELWDSYLSHIVSDPQNGA